MALLPLLLLLLLPLQLVVMITVLLLINEVLPDRQGRVTTHRRGRVIPTKDSSNRINISNDVRISHRTHRSTEDPSSTAGGIHRAVDLLAHTWAAEVRP